MRLSLRFILPLILVLSAIAYGVTPLIDSLTFRWFSRDLEMRTQLITHAIQESFVILIKDGSRAKVQSLFRRVTQDERLYAIGFCDIDGNLLYKSETFPKAIDCGKTDREPAQVSIISLPDGPLHVAFQPISEEGRELGRLILAHDMSFVERRSQDTRKYLFYLFLALGLIVSGVTVFVAQLSWKGWVSGIRELLQAAVQGALIQREGILRGGRFGSPSPELQPIAKDIRDLIHELESDRAVRDENQISWTSSALKEILQRELAGEEILIVSNRQPYIHNRAGDHVEVQVPASGLVTALEPIMRACSGTWIAHGNGSADQDVVDANDRIDVPPETPSYSIRRVWLTKEEEAGYYYGFSNEGLWPLCHIAHTRPIFRSEDWNQYVRVNRKFAEAVVQETKTDAPVILVQDYHFALLPKMIKEKLPKATIITFWHIPWPNPEAFGICPWREELLDGLLGSSILGFHTRFHCNNFIDTVDRFMECRIDRETSTVSYGGKLTAINHYPISIEWPSRWLKSQKPMEDCQKSVRKTHSLPESMRLGIGVDRMDYTKGILERFMAVERFLELHPEWIGRFAFIQIAAPSRSTIEQYQSFEAHVVSMAKKINRKFSRTGYEPIILKVGHHEPNQVFEYFRAADLCFVSSLHDGMNLVAKEFIASREDELGVLILSQFTGASRELPQALIVNPYNIDQCASALRVALEMPPNEQRIRMRTMRGLVQEFNVYRWAGRMLMGAARIRQQNRFKGAVETPAPLRKLPR